MALRCQASLVAVPELPPQAPAKSSDAAAAAHQRAARPPKIGTNCY